MGGDSSSTAGKVTAHIRSVATAATAQDLQEKSHYAAKINLKSRERKFYAPPTADAIIASGKPSSEKSGVGQEAFIVHVGRKKVFASRSFVPFGACQKSIGKSLDISARTVRRHLDAFGVERRQLMQSKGEYGRCVTAMKIEADSCYLADDLFMTSCGNAYELNERSRGAKKWNAGQLVTPDRFSYYYGKYWIYRCNLYQTSVTLTSMRKAKRVLARSMGVDSSGNPISPPVTQSAETDLNPSVTPISLRRLKKSSRRCDRGCIQGSQTVPG
jgi:hypothetical protein